jgi:hypothetical protein
MVKTLLLIKNDISGTWVDVFNHTQSSTETLQTSDDILSYIQRYYSSPLGNYTVEITDNEVYTIGDRIIPCINCP